MFEDGFARIEDLDRTIDQMLRQAPVAAEIDGAKRNLLVAVVDGETLFTQARLVARDTT